MWLFSAPPPSREAEILRKLDEILEILRNPVLPPPRTGSPMIICPPPPTPEILQIPEDMYSELKARIAQRRLQMGDSCLFTY